METCDPTEAAARSGAGIEELRRPVDLQGVAGVRTCTPRSCQLEQDRRAAPTPRHEVTR